VLVGSRYMPVRARRSTALSAIAPIVPLLRRSRQQPRLLAERIRVPPATVRSDREGNEREIPPQIERAPANHNHAGERGNEVHDARRTRLSISSVSAVSRDSRSPIGRSSKKPATALQMTKNVVTQ